MDQLSKDMAQQALKDRLKIDTSRLDRELIEQAHLFHEAAEQHALAVSIRDAQHTKIKRMQSTLYVQIEQELSGSKATQLTITNKIESSEEIAAMREELLMLTLEADTWAALKEALNQRSYMLRDLCQLQLAGLGASATVYASPSAQQASVQGNREAMHRARTGG